MGENLSQEQLKDTWKKVANGNIEEIESLRPVIRESWKRCLQNKVNPFLRKIPVVLSDDELLAREMAQKELIDISLPVMDSLYRFVEKSGFIVVLADSSGTLLKVIGDPWVKESVEKGNFIPGADWSEETAGTNAIGTVLKTGEPIQIFGSEHFCLVSQQWTCSSAPIRDPAGNIIGVLDMTGTFEKVHSHTLGMVAAAVYAIENQILARRARESAEVANNYKNTIIESISEGLLAVDPKGLVSHVNKAAAGIFSRPPEEIVNRPIDLFLGEKNKAVLKIITGQRYVTDQEVNIFNGAGKTTCLLTSRPICTNNKNEGTVVLFNEIARARKLVQHMSGSEAKFTFADIVGRNEKFLNTVRLAKAISGSTSNVLLLGESGTGKDMFAQAIHNGSMRGNGPFVAINCGAIPRELITSELFGYSEGAFTGARRGGKPGKFELANGGTIFLDEIGEMPLQLQIILLRVLEQKTITRIGGNDLIPVDVRIIAATNKDLQVEVTKGNFRQDLYYRLNVVRIDMVPLRERKEDITLLIEHFFEQLRLKLNKERLVNIDREVIETLKNYPWPGNVRELQNVLERAVNISQGPTLALADLPSDLKLAESKGSFLSMELYEQEMIKNILALHNGNISRAAGELGIARSTLYRKIYKYNININ
ncbi:MAG: sigma-54-dependent Fis family transcriptional regulator [Bacillota bacterium]